MRGANQFSLFQVSQSTPGVFRKKLEENNDLIRKAEFVLTAGVILLVGGAVVVFTGSVIFFLLVPAVVVLGPLFLFLSVLSVLNHKVVSMLWQRRRNGRIRNYNNRVRGC